LNRLLDNFIREHSLNIEYTSCPITRITGNKKLVEDVGGIFCKHLKEQKKHEKCYNLSPVHGRSCLLNSSHGYVHIKGVGWAFGPPYVFSAEKEPDLIYGLFDSQYASREIAISTILSEQNITNARSVAKAELISEWLPKYDMPREFIPSLLYTLLPCPYRVADLGYLDLNDRLTLIRIVCKFSHFKTSSSTEEFIELFISRLVTATSKLHSIGGVNDHLTYDNVTISGDIIDFEWLYLPGMPCPDGTTDIILDHRQEKSGLYILEVTHQLSRLLGIDYNLQFIAKRALKYSTCKHLTKLFDRIIRVSN